MDGHERNGKTTLELDSRGRFPVMAFGFPFGASLGTICDLEAAGLSLNVLLPAEIHDHCVIYDKWMNSRRELTKQHDKDTNIPHLKLRALLTMHRQVM